MMGRAVIVENIGESLYKIRLDIDIAGLEAEIAELEALQERYNTDLTNAYLALVRAEDAVQAAGAGLDAVIGQWIEGLITEHPEGEQPPEILTQGGYVDPDGAELEAELLALINAARMAESLDELSPVESLRNACSDALEGIMNGYTRITRDPKALASTRGYFYDSAAGVDITLALGATSVASAAERMTDGGPVMAASKEDIGVRYVRAEGSGYTHLWAVMTAAPGPDSATATATYPDEEAEKAEKAVDGVDRPEDEMTPSKLAQACGDFARAVQAHKAAKAAMEQMMEDFAQRTIRIAALEKIIADAQIPVFAWAVECMEGIPVGDTVSTAEIPGWYRHATTPASTTIDDATYRYQESRINIIRTQDAGLLRHPEIISDAAVAFFVAMEPGHLKWQPIWRYGTITAIDGASCAVTLEDVTARMPPLVRDNLALDPTATLAGVLIVAECVDYFEVGDEVLIQFAGRSRESPQVIGWRREPKCCGRYGGWWQPQWL